jgi:hypothetical protein
VFQSDKIVEELAESVDMECITATRMIKRYQERVDDDDNQNRSTDDQSKISLRMRLEEKDSDDESNKKSLHRIPNRMKKKTIAVRR